MKSKFYLKTFPDAHVVKQGRERCGYASSDSLGPREVHTRYAYLVWKKSLNRAFPVWYPGMHKSIRGIRLLSPLHVTRHQL
jgi:hypothetical protein